MYINPPTNIGDTNTSIVIVKYTTNGIVKHVSINLNIVSPII